jgi:hypothetical protein
MNVNTLNFHINHGYVVTIKIDKNTLDVTLPRNVIAKDKSSETNLIYKIHQNYIEFESLTDDILNKKLLKDIPSYAIRPLILSDIAILARKRGISPQLILILGTDKYVQATFKNMNILHLSQEDIDRELYLFEHLDSIISNNFSHLKADTHEGCKILFDCFKNGGIV